MVALRRSRPSIHRVTEKGSSRILRFRFCPILGNSVAGSKGFSEIEDSEAVKGGGFLL